MDKSLVKNAVFNVLYKLMNVLFPLITSVYIARVLLSEGVGKVSYAQTYASLFVLIASLGIPAYGVKVIARFNNSAESEELSKAFSELILILWISTTICLGFYIASIICISEFKEDYLLYVAVGIQILLVGFDVDWFYQGKEEYAYITVRSFVVKLISLVSILLLVKTRNDYITYALICSIAVAGNNLCNVYQLRKYVKYTTKGIDIYKHLKPVFILMLSTIAIQLYSKVDVIMLGSMSNHSSIAYYSNAFKVINVLVLAVTSVTGVFLPRLSLQYKENKKEFYRLINIGVWINLFISLPAFIGLALEAQDFVLVMFGESFKPSGTTLLLLSPLVMVKSLGDLICYQAVISIGKEKYFLVTNCAAAIMNIVLNYILIPKFSHNGAAIASISSELIVNFGMFLLIKEYLGLYCERRVFVPIFISGVIMFTVVWLVREFALDNTIIRFSLCVLLGTVSYILVNYFMHNKLVVSMVSMKKNI